MPSLADDEEFIDLFIDEAKIAVQLLHVNIVQVFELGEVNGQYFMALEYVHGLDLARLVSRAKNRGAFPLPLALFIVAEVLKALAFAHERRDEKGRPLHIVHCDISPQNILVSFSGEVKITDFGISRAAFQAKSLHDVIRGKYAYMSPEQVEGKRSMAAPTCLQPRHRAVRAADRSASVQGQDARGDHRPGPAR